MTCAIFCLRATVGARKPVGSITKLKAVTRNRDAKEMRFKKCFVRLAIPVKVFHFRKEILVILIFHVIFFLRSVHARLEPL